MGMRRQQPSHRSLPAPVALLIAVAAVLAGGPGVGPRPGLPAMSRPAGEQPAPRHIRLLYTANTWGYIEYCDCGPVRLGGLDRRSAAIAAAREPGLEVLLLDLGNLLEISEEPPTQLGRLQADFLVEEMVGMRYDLVAVGARDLLGEPSFVAASLGRLGKPLLLTNLAPGADLGFPVAEVKRFDIAGIILEFFAIVDPLAAGEPAALVAWEPALRTALQASANRADPADVRVVIAHLPAAGYGAGLAALLALEGVDLVLDGTTMMPRDAWRYQSGFVLMNAANRGQQLALLDLEVVPRAIPMPDERAGIVDFQGLHVPLPPTHPVNPDIRHRMDAFRSKLVSLGLIPPA